MCDGEASLKHLKVILRPGKDFLTVSNRIGVIHMLGQAEQVDYSWLTYRRPNGEARWPSFTCLISNLVSSMHNYP